MKTLLHQFVNHGGPLHEIFQTPEEWGRLTFPISLNQLGPRDSLIRVIEKLLRIYCTMDWCHRKMRLISCY